MSGEWLVWMWRYGSLTVDTHEKAEKAAARLRDRYGDRVRVKPYDRGGMPSE